MSTITLLDVTGMTCAHCVTHVTEELRAIPAVEDVSIVLDPDGVTKVTVFSDDPLDEAAVREAIDEAGDYRVEGYTVRTSAIAAEATAQHAERTAHGCGCGGQGHGQGRGHGHGHGHGGHEGCACGGHGAGEAYNRAQGTYNLSVPPRDSDA